MNKRAFRLVFDRRRNMRVPAAEHARAAGKPAGGASPAARVLACALGTAALLPAGPIQAQPTRPPVVFASRLPAPAQALPVPYGGSTGRSDRSFVANPAQAPGVTWKVDGKKAVLDQGTAERVILNWDSFDIGAGFAVYFKQDKDPAKYVSALNRIWSADPSVILGSLTADREVILLNANGVYFGRGAVVDTGKFVATSLNIADAVFERGLRQVTDGSAVFDTAGLGYLPTRLDGAISVEAGAEIRSAAGGDVLLVAPRVVNQGRIETPAGQTVMAAGDKVYLMSSSDPAQRGLIVAVDPIKVLTTRVDPVSGAVLTEEVIDRGLGIVENAATGSYKTQDGRVVTPATPDATSGLVNKLNEIRAESGSVNLVALTVRQNGVINATTAVKGANGAVYLQAQQATTTLDNVAAAARGLRVDAGARVTVSDALGTVVVGGSSRTEVRPAETEATQLDAEVFNPSRIRVEGQAVHLQSGAQLSAPAGRIEILAAARAQESTLFTSNAGVLAGADGSRIVVDPGVVIDAGGLRDVALDGSRNQGELRLFRIELADAPVQRSGPLYRSPVQFDLRGAEAISAANVAGAANGIGRTATERSTAGGSVRIEGEGAVVVGDGARIDISGGSVRYGQTTLKTSLLLRNGRIVAFDLADKGLRYDGLSNLSQARVVPAYDEGKDGGSLSVLGRVGYFGAAIQADVVNGAYQRGASEQAAPSSATFGRLSGVTQYLRHIGLSEAGGATPSADFFAAALEAPTAGLAEGFDLSLAALRDSGLGRLNLRADEVRQQDGGGLDLGVGGGLDIAARSISLAGAYLAPGGRISMRTSNVLEGDEATLGNIDLAAGTVLSTAGLWTNDLATPAGAAAAPLQTQGGSIELSAARSVVTAADTRIDVSAGAWLPASRKLSQGRAGQLSLLAGTDIADATLHLGGEIAGFDFSAGGALTLAVPGLDIAYSATGAFTLAPAFFSANGFGSINVRSLGDVVVRSGTMLAPQLRNWVLDGGSTGRPSGEMAAGAASPQWLDEALVDRKPVSLSMSALRQPGASAALPGSSLHVERGAGIELEPGGKLVLQAARDITVGVIGGDGPAPAVLRAPGGSVDLRITGRRGASSLESAGEDQVGFIAEQALWLGAGATVDAAGTAELRIQRATRFDASVPLFATGAPDDRVQVGTVLGGGNVTLDAARGYVVAEAGSRITVDGSAAALTLPGLSTPVTVARPAGAVNVLTPEGFRLDGEISAQAPRDAAGQALAAGGRLKLELGTGGASRITLAVGRPYPENEANPRRIVVGGPDAGVSTLRYGDDLTAALGNGAGDASASLLTGSGFDSLLLRAGDKLFFAESVSLQLQQDIEIDAPSIGAAAGAQVRLQAPRVVIGNPSFTRNGDAPAADTAAVPAAGPADQAARLSIEADLIEVQGQSGLTGFATTELHATRSPGSEIRLVGYLGPASTQGAFNFAGTLDLRAPQIYATTYSRFDLAGLGSWQGVAQPSTIKLGRPDVDALPSKPLSAFAQVRLSATDILHDGVLRQPFGVIDLQAAGTLTLGADSVTSVSGQGLVVPFGTTTNLAQWFSPVVSQEVRAPLTDKRISIAAGRVVTQSRPVIDAQGRVVRTVEPVLDAAGGGDLQAWEFFPGVGGSTDYFTTPGLYAVLPGYRGAYAPRSEDSSSAIQTGAAGTQIEITMAGSGLAPGRYTFLPARYALLADSQPDGAYLVRLSADQGSAVLARPIVQDDGSTVVTGYLSQPGLAAMGVPGQRFVVEAASVARERAEIRTSRMSDFFAERAATLGNAVGALPRDAGAVKLDVADGADTVLRAAFDLAAVAGARAGTLDIAAPQIALVPRVTDEMPAPAGFLTVEVDTLNESLAGSVLLGGTRTSAPAGVSGLPAFDLDTTRTQLLRVDSVPDAVRMNPELAKALPDGRLAIGELILAARAQVSVAPLAELQAVGDATLGARELRLSGDGALALISAHEDVRVQRLAAALVNGDLDIGGGSTLGGTEILFDATGRLSLDPTANLQTTAFDLRARRIALGGASTEDGATVLAGAALGSLGALDALRLRSYTSIDFVGKVDLAARATPGGAPTQVLDSLVLDAPTLRGLPLRGEGGAVQQAASADLAARSVVIQNTAQTINPISQLPAPAVPELGLAGEGSLRIQSLPDPTFGSTGGTLLGAGTQRLAFADARLQSSGDIVVAGSGSRTAQGELTLSASRLTGRSDAVQTVAATGKLRIEATAQDRSLGERVGQGAQLVLSGAVIEQAGLIDLPAGRLSFDGTGAGADAAAVHFEPGSVTRAAGFTQATADGRTLSADGGQIRATAREGRIDAFGTLDVGAATVGAAGAVQGDGGSLAFSAVGAGGSVRFEASVVGVDGTTSTQRATLVGTGGTSTGDRGGRFALDVQAQDPDATGTSTLAATLPKVVAGGFDREFSLRVRSGDLRLAGPLAAERIGITVDQGALTLDAATLRADAPQGGVVTLQAQGDLIVSGGTLVSARSSRDGANGGDILLSSAAGRLRLASTAEIDASGDGAADGRIVLRAARSGASGGVEIDPLSAGALQAGEVDIEAFRVYRTVTASGVTRDITTIASGNSVIAGSGTNRTGALGQSTLRSDSAAYMMGADATLTALGLTEAERARIHLRAGVEVQAAGNLTVSSDWSLAGDRPGGDAGLLTLRAAGNLTINGAISDGFASASASAAINDNARSWSYRLSAGADLGSADLLATRDLTTGSVETGNLSIAAGRAVRTGAGSIALAAGRDIVFGGTASGAPGQVFVAGRKASDQDAVLSSLFASQTVAPGITEQGGSLELRARRDIRASAPNQFIGNWFWRTGVIDPLDPSRYSSDGQGAWWPQFNRFQQTAASFGGGNVRVEAGRDITSLAVLSPTTAWADSVVTADAGLVVRNGGDIDVEAGANITDVQFLLGRGAGFVRAGGSLLSSAPTSGRGTSFAIIDGTWDIAVRGDARIAAVYNPTLTPPASADSRPDTSGYFITYGRGSAFDMSSLTGDITLAGLGSSFFGTFRLAQGPNAGRLYQLLPENLNLSAYGGDVVLGSGVSALLAPSSDGRLEVFAAGDFSLGGNATLGMVDLREAALPTLTSPVDQSELRRLTDTLGGVINVLRTESDGTRAIGDQQTRGTLRADDEAPVRIAAQGSISAGLNGALNLSKQARLSAGADISNLTLLGQHHDEADLTRVEAGRNVLLTDRGGFSLAGPGRLQISAGRQLDLGASLGVATTGNVSNPGLSPIGASVVLTAAGKGRLDVAQFVARYLVEPAAGGSAAWTAHRDTLTQFVRTALRDGTITYERALEALAGFPQEAQATLAQSIRDAEFGARYLLGGTATASELAAQLQRSFETYKASLLEAGEATLAARGTLVLPGNEQLEGDRLATYLTALRALSFGDVDVDAAIAQRIATQARHERDWREAVAASQGRSLAEIEGLSQSSPQDPSVLAYQQGLRAFSGPLFQAQSERVLRAEISSAGQAASPYGLRTLPLRMAFYDQGFAALELYGLGNFEPTAYWPGPATSQAFAGTMNMTQSSVVTRRGGDISLLNPGGAINVGLKDASGARNGASGVIALGGGDVFGVARDDFQVNTQRVFVVGTGDMTLWSSLGDIDSGRGQNTAVGTPPLAARRSVDGVVFEVPATTTGSGLGILADANGLRSGTIGLYPAFGEIRALDALIRAPSVVVGSTIKGADNLKADATSGQAPIVTPPPATAAPPASNESRQATAAADSTNQESRPRNSLLTVELLGLGADDPCEGLTGTALAECRRLKQERPRERP